VDAAMNKRRRRNAKAVARAHKRAVRQFDAMEAVLPELWPSAEEVRRCERGTSLLEELGPTNFLSLRALIEEKAQRNGIVAVRLSPDEAACVHDPSSDLEAVVNIMARHLAPNSTRGS
jgi:transposase